MEPGRVRFRPSGSAGGHNGLKSIEQTLGTKDYPRLRLGVGAKPEGMDLAAWEMNGGSPEWANGRKLQRPGALISVGGALTLAVAGPEGA